MSNVTSVTSGITSTSFVVSPGDTLLVESGGTAVGTTIESGGLLIIDQGGTAISATNSGTIEASGAGQSVVLTGPVTNSGTVETLGNAQVEIDGATITGGTLRTTGAGEIGVFGGGDTASVTSATVSGSIVDNGMLTFDGGTLGTGAKFQALNGGTLTLSSVALGKSDQFLAGDDSTILISSGGDVTLSAGTLAEAINGGTVDVSATGSITNSGTVEAFASGYGDISSASVSGGTITNVKTIEALTTSYGSAVTQVDGATVSNSGVVLASAGYLASAEIDIGSAGATTSITNTGTIEALASAGGAASATLSGTISVTNSGTIEVSAGAGLNTYAALTVAGGAVSNAKTIEVLATDATASASISGSSVTNSRTITTRAATHGFAATTISGDSVVNGGTWDTAASGDSESDLSVYFSTGFTNSSGATMTVSAGGTSLADATISGADAFTNSGTFSLVAGGFSTASGTLTGAGITNSGTMRALADGRDALAQLQFSDAGGGTVTILNSGGTIFASAGGGGTAWIDLNSATISGGTLHTTGVSGAIGLFDAGDGDGTISGATVLGHSNIIALTGTLTLENIMSFGAADDLFASGGILNIDGGTTLVTGDFVEASNGGVANLSGAITNSGTIEALDQVATTGVSSGVVPAAARVTVNAGGSTLDNIGYIEAVGSTTSSGLATVSVSGDIVSNPGIIEAIGNAAVVVGGGTVNNTRAMEALAPSTISGSAASASLTISTVSSVVNSRTMLASAGAINSASLVISGGSSITNTNTGTMQALATVDGAVSLTVAATSVTNSGTIEVAASTNASASLTISGTTVSNAGAVEAIGAGNSYATMEIVSGTTVSNSTKGVILASGHAEIDLDGGTTISGGTLRTIGNDAYAVVSSGAVALDDVAIAANSFVAVISGGAALTLGNGTTITHGAAVEAYDGEIDVSGTVINSGVLSAAGGTVDIVSGATVTGVGVIDLSNGTIVIDGATSETVDFQSGGSGALVLADSSGNTSAYGGTISGFGAPNGADTAESIVLDNVVSSGTITTSYTANALHPTSSGVLTVSSGGSAVASINLAGDYTTANFEITSSTSGFVEIIDPAVDQTNHTIANGATVTIGTATTGKETFAGSTGSLVLDDATAFFGQVAGFGAKDTIDLADIGFGAQTTLGYSASADGNAGTLTVGDGTQTANIALLGSYIAGSFVTASDGHGGTLVSEATKPEPASLTLPQHT